MRGVPEEVVGEIGEGEKGGCENCVAQSHVDSDFIFERKHLSDKDGNPKEIKVEVVNVINGKTMDFKDIGEPTINIRMLH